MSEHDERSQGEAGLSPLPLMSSVVVGWLDPSSTPARLCVDFAGNGRGAIVARTTVVLSETALMQAVAARQGVLLVFENADPKLPIIIGLIQTPEANLLGALLGAPRSEAAPARLDGESVALEGKREVVLRCGDASLTLRRDGKVLIRGAYVETHARGINRIKGGAVKIN